MEPHKREALPFNTHNAALAVMLKTFGVPCPVDEKGRAYPCRNSYSVNTLRGIEEDRRRSGRPPLGIKGKALEDGIRVAFQAGVPGDVEYYFVKTPMFYALMEGWEEQEKLIAESAKRGNAGASRSESLPIMGEVAGKIACQLSRTRKEFFGDKNITPIWKLVPPVAVRADTHDTPHDASDPKRGHVTRGSFSARTVKV